MAVRTTYIPTFLAELGLGAMMPLFALSVVALDHSAAIAAGVVALYSGGRILGSYIGGRFCSYLGYARAAMLGLAVLAGGAVLCWLSGELISLTVGVMLVGVGHAVYHVARQGQIARFIPPTHRARALTTLAGIWRIANFIGPLVGAAIIAAWGLPASYAFAAITVVVAMAALAVSPAWGDRARPHEHAHASAVSVIRANASVLGTLGMAVMFTGAVRGVRILVIPLWAEHIGATDSMVSLIFALSAGVDMLLFYPAGIVADRWGRAWTVVPSTVLIALGLVLLPFTTTPVMVAVAAMIIGFGNGWGSGALMTLGNDAAPAVGRDMFIGIWTILVDVGGLVGPAAVSAVAVASLPWSLWGIGAVGLVTSGALAAWVPRKPVDGAAVLEQGKPEETGPTGS
ncbi:MFS transporter [Demequina sediminicola]|uniref:MFS transporter n=1 Tax=Demequina sediminicola TaxID=1095026 RepID=UPI000780BD59|nr:MFS transporter [Demequina sediminicola]